MGVRRSQLVVLENSSVIIDLKPRAYLSGGLINGNFTQFKIFDKMFSIHKGGW